LVSDYFDSVSFVVTYTDQSIDFLPRLRGLLVARYRPKAWSSDQCMESGRIQHVVVPYSGHSKHHNTRYISLNDFGDLFADPVDGNRMSTAR